MAESTRSRRQFRLSISSDMEDIWRRLKDVRPRGATRELEWLLRLGILAESGLRAGGPAFATFMASIAAPQPGLGRALTLGGGQFQPKSAAQDGPDAEPLPQSRFDGWSMREALGVPQ